MPEMNPWQMVLSGIVTLLGAGGVYALAKPVLPALKSAWESATANNRAEKDMIERQQGEIARLQAENDGYRAREAGYIKMAGKMELIEYQLKQANERIAELTAEIKLLKGAK